MLGRCAYMHAHIDKVVHGKICFRLSFLDRATHSCPVKKVLCRILLVLTLDEFAGSKNGVIYKHRTDFNRVW